MPKANHFRVKQGKGVEQKFITEKKRRFHHTFSYSEINKKINILKSVNTCCKLWSEKAIKKSIKFGLENIIMSLAHQLC